MTRECIRPTCAFIAESPGGRWTIAVLPRHAAGDRVTERDLDQQPVAAAQPPWAIAAALLPGAASVITALV